MRAYLEGYGCTLNKADSNIIRGILEQEGAELVASPEDADFIFLNTCAVKLATERRMVSRIRVLSTLPGTLVVCGCLPQINRKEILKVAHPIMLDTNSLNRIPDVLRGLKQNLFSGKHTAKLGLPCHCKGQIVPVPISEGCLGECTYCGVRNARGRLTSYPVGEITSVCGRAVQNGARELQLTSQDCGAYGMDIGASLPQLVGEVASIPGEFMVRVGMMNPNHVMGMLPELLGAYESGKVYKFLHLPVQSGSDKVLVEMNRKYKADDFVRIVDAFRERFPKITVCTDIIVGFPTEGEGDFEQTAALLELVRPDMANISKFYPRPMTKAAGMKKLNTKVIKRRSVALSKLCRAISLEQNRKNAGTECTATPLEHNRDGSPVARLPNYRRVAVKGAEVGKKCRVRVIDAPSNHLVGVLVPQ